MHGNPAFSIFSRGHFEKKVVHAVRLSNLCIVNSAIFEIIITSLIFGTFRREKNYVSLSHRQQTPFLDVVRCAILDTYINHSEIDMLLTLCGQVSLNFS